MTSTYQEYFEEKVQGRKIVGVEWLQKWDDGDDVSKDTPIPVKFILDDGDFISFDGCAEVYYF